MDDISSMNGMFRVSTRLKSTKQVLQVQLGSTATRGDGGVSWWTLQDADLRGWMRVDALPADGM